eukprot:Colp12_sorted_trinity150504_noHs@6302
MGRHSKNNTALPFFTHHERKELGYGTQKERVGKDSCKEFDACFLCLQTCIKPVCCLQGHLACKECLFENLLAQKKEITRQEKAFHEQLEKEKEEMRQQEVEQKIKAVEDFQATQGSLLPKKATATNGPKSELEEDLKRKDMDLEKKRALPSFWLPSHTPNAEATKLKPPSKDTMCPGNDHTLKLKQLVEVKFVPVSSSNGKKSGDKYECPGCVKSLTNNLELKVMKKCGHVMCKACVDKFIKESARCLVCDGPCSTKDVITLHRDGTGYAASGSGVAERYNYAFQCA